MTLDDAISRVAAHLERARVDGRPGSRATPDQVGTVLAMLEDAGIVQWDPAPRPRTVWLDVVETRGTRPKARVDVEHASHILRQAGYDVVRRPGA